MKQHRQCPERRLASSEDNASANASTTTLKSREIQDRSTTIPSSTTKSSSSSRGIVSVKLPPSLLSRRAHARPSQSLNLLTRGSKQIPFTTTTTATAIHGSSSTTTSPNTTSTTTTKSTIKDLRTTTKPNSESMTTSSKQKQQPQPQRPRKLIPNITRIGGPGTMLPFLVESFIVWILAISCLTVACWHYIVQLYGNNSTTRRRSLRWPLTNRKRRKIENILENSNDEATRIPPSSSELTSLSSSLTSSPPPSTNNALLCSVPLCTHSRRELDTVRTHDGFWMRYQQLIDRLEMVRTISEWILPQNRTALIHYIRTTDTVRRLVSLVMTRRDWLVQIATRHHHHDQHRQLSSSSSSPSSLSKVTTATTTTTKPRVNQNVSILAHVLQDIWPQLLVLPQQYEPFIVNEYDCTTTSDDDINKEEDTCNQFQYDLSVVMPLYRENGVDLIRKLQTAISGIQSPLGGINTTKRTNIESTSTRKICHIEFVLVDAGQCQNMEIVEEFVQRYNHDDDQDSPATNQYPNATGHVNQPISIAIHKYHGGGGRGPCLNFGARLAKGRILTFLHADTRLVPGWDMTILNAFDNNNNKNHDRKDDNVATTPSVTTTACAFSFAIDTSPSALCAHNSNAYYPPGIKAIETTANWRTHLFHLPYGDQCLSIPSNVFWYIGGYPDQCLLEDYELIRLLRQRVAAMTETTRFPSSVSSSSSSKSDNYCCRPERLAILPLKAFCSPRRWQCYGVWFVTYMNSYVINCYAKGSTPDELFVMYYGTSSAPPRQNEKSLWEIQLDHELFEGRKR